MHKNWVIFAIILRGNTLKVIEFALFMQENNNLSNNISQDNEKQKGGEPEGFSVNKKGFIEVDGKVLELLPNATFKIELENGHEILAHLSGRMRMHKIRILPFDNVKVEMSPYDTTKGRITYRY